VRARHSDRRRRDVRAGLAKPDLLGTRDKASERFGKLRFKLGCKGKGDTGCKLPPDRQVNIRIAISKYVWQQRSDQINVLISIDVPGKASLTMGKEKWSRSGELEVAFAERLRGEWDEVFARRLKCACERG
jgi:hypothetical protein